MEDCVFCKIVAGEIPSAQLIVTDTVYSFLDIGPVNPGHSLVIPRRHARTIADVTEQEFTECAKVARTLALAVMAATDSPGCNILQNNHRSAGQLVQHVHIHVIPRSPDDGFRLGWRSAEYGSGEMEQILEAIRKEL